MPMTIQVDRAVWERLWMCTNLSVETSLQCVQKKIFVISSENSGDSDDICYTDSWINLLQNEVTFFHLTWIMSLHVALLIGHVLPLRCYRQKLRNLSHLSCGHQIRKIWIQLITVCWDCCKMYKLCITALGELKQQLRTEWAKLDHAVIVAVHCLWLTV